MKFIQAIFSSRHFIAYALASLLLVHVFIAMVVFDNRLQNPEDIKCSCSFICWYPDETPSTEPFNPFVILTLVAGIVEFTLLGALLLSFFLLPIALYTGRRSIRSWFPFLLGGVSGGTVFTLLALWYFPISERHLSMCPEPRFEYMFVPAFVFSFMAYWFVAVRNAGLRETPAV